MTILPFAVKISRRMMSYSDEDVVFSDLHKLSVDITNKNIDNINIVMK